MKYLGSVRVFVFGLAMLWAGAIGAAEADSPILPPKEGPVGDKHRPAIAAIAAQNEIGDGYLWKIYLHALDPDGDLDKVHITFSQAGGGAITSSLLAQKKKTANLNGYIVVWARLEGTNRSTNNIQASADIRVEDRAGNMSEKKVLEFEVSTFGPKDKFVPPKEFNAKNKLGQAEFGLLTEDENIGDNRLP